MTVILVTPRDAMKNLLSLESEWPQALATEAREKGNEDRRVKS